MKRDEYGNNEYMFENLKKDVKGAYYIIQSTLNQVVNYIPAKMFDFQGILNLTITDSLRFDNEKWDKNLFETLSLKPQEIKIKQSELNNIENIKKILKNKIEGQEKIFWNITGGQRPFVLAVYDMIRDTGGKQHFICYLEGNKHQMIVLDRNFNTIFTEDYEISDTQILNIEKSLKLMGFETKDLNSTRQKKDIFTGEDKICIESITNKYLDDSNFRNELILSKGRKDAFEDALKSYCNSTFLQNYHGNSLTKFGYLLEDMALYLIYQNKNLWNKILDIRSSVKLYQQDKQQQIIDEFDILVLNRYGHIINFECKSGGMTGDVAKSTNFSTYAISGVYGKPILITPLLQSELDHPENKNYKKIKEAIKAAERANLEIWGLDKITDNLEKYL